MPERPLEVDVISGAWRTITLAMAVLVASQVAAQSMLNTALEIDRSVAIDGLPSTGYFILTQDGVIYHYVPGEGGLQFKNRFEIPNHGQPIDLTFARSDKQDSIVVTSWSNGVNAGFLTRFTPEGQVIKSWMVHKVAAGVDFDPNKDWIYFSTADSREVYRVSIRNGDPQYFCGVRDAGRLGALIVAHGGQDLYIADTREGRVFRVEVSTKRVTLIPRQFKSPTALHFDEEKNLLYVADSIGRQVVALNPTGPASAPVAIVAGEGLESPSGLAPGEGGMLLISDYKAGRVFRVSPDLAGISSPKSPKVQK